MQFRRARTMEELLEDKEFLYYVGQLIGAVEVASHWMRSHMEGDVKDMGEKLAETSAWFFQTQGKGRLVGSESVSDKK